MHTNLAITGEAGAPGADASGPAGEAPAAPPANVSTKRLSLRRRGDICLRKAKKAVQHTCTALGAEAREELVSALMPALWRRVRNWRLKNKSFADFAEQAAFQSLKDYLRRMHTSRDALDRAAVGLDEFGDGV